MPPSLVMTVHAIRSLLSRRRSREQNEASLSCPDVSWGAQHHTQLGLSASEANSARSFLTSFQASDFLGSQSNAYWDWHKAHKPLGIRYPSYSLKITNNRVGVELRSRTCLACMRVQSQAPKHSPPNSPDPMATQPSISFGLKVVYSYDNGFCLCKDRKSRSPALCSRTTNPQIGVWKLKSPALNYVECDPGSGTGLLWTMAFHG